MQVILLRSGVRRTHHPGPRSGCPVSVSLEMLGDRWSLLIVRDLMVRGYKTFKQFQESGEGIASNILADRLQKLEAAGIVAAEAEQSDGRKINYRLTEKGIDLAPVLLELMVWGARHATTFAPCSLIDHVVANREAFLADARRRWRDRDPDPLLPKFPERPGFPPARVDSGASRSSVERSRAAGSLARFSKSKMKKAKPDKQTGRQSGKEKR